MSRLSVNLAALIQSVQTMDTTDKVGVIHAYTFSQSKQKVAASDEFW